MSVSVSVDRGTFEADRCRWLVHPRTRIPGNE